MTFITNEMSRIICLIANGHPCSAEAHDWNGNYLCSDLGTLEDGEPCQSAYLWDVSSIDLSGSAGALINSLQVLKYVGA